MSSVNRSLSRREWSRLASLGLLAAPASGWLPQLAQRLHAQESGATRPKSCILIWLDGGPSQCHTFSVPEKDADYGAIETSVPGLRISEHLPMLAKSMHEVAVLRTMSTGINEHRGGQYLMHTGHRASVAVDYPTVGSIVAHECGREGTGLPNFVSIGQASVPPRFMRSGPLGPEYSPMMLSGSSIANLKSPIRIRTDERLELLRHVQEDEVARFRAESIRAHRTSYRKAVDLMRTDATKAFDDDLEPKEVRERYGDRGFGEQCLLARRLVEAGVAFVEIGWGGWDHHGGAAEPVRKRSPEMDRGFSALIEDLSDRGLLESTLVVWMGEFGRGPKPGLGGGNNGKSGSGHFAKCWTTVLAGAGVKGGQVVGKTTPDRVDVADHPISAGDFFATICRALDVDHTDTYEAAGRPVPFTATGSEPLAELF